MSRRTILTSAVGASGFAAVGGRVTAQETVTVRVDVAPDTIEPGETTEATVSISEIPTGLAGLLGNASVTDSSVAQITGVSFPDGWGLTQDPEISSDGSSVRLVTADVLDNYTAGETDVELFTLEFEGIDWGRTSIDLENLVEDEDGNFYDVALDSETLTINTEPPEGVTFAVDFSDDTIPYGDTTEATVSIAEIPDGLAGLSGDAMVTSSSVAEITGVSFPEEWGHTQEPEISADRSSVRLSTADVDDNYVAGETNVELFTLELEGVGQGSIEIDLEDLAENEDGDFYVSRTASPMVRVGAPPPTRATFTVDFSDDTIPSGDTTEATVSIAEIPNGLAGLLGDAMVTDSSVAQITDATYADDWGLSQDPEISADGSSVELVVADVDDNYVAGETNVELFTLELEGVGQGETEIDLEDLAEESDGGFYVSDVDSETVSVDGETDLEPDPDALVVDDFESSGQTNDLGRWRGGSSFQNGGGEITDGKLVLEYDGAGWYASQVDEDLSDYSELVLSVRGDSGGEESDFTVSLGGAQTLVSNVADGSISTSTSDLRIDLDALGANRSSPGQLCLTFWRGGSSTVTIDQIRFE